jgi:hypothetical protein
MFQINYVDEFEKTLLMLNNFSRKSCRLCDNVGKYGTNGQATDDNMAHALCVLDNLRATDIDSEHLILTAFPRQQWLRERVLMLLSYVHRLACHLLAESLLLIPVMCLLTCRSTAAHIPCACCILRGPDGGTYRGYCSRRDGARTSVKTGSWAGRTHSQ